MEWQEELMKNDRDLDFYIKTTFLLSFQNAYSSQAALPWWLTPQDPHHAVPSAFSTPPPPRLLADSYCVPAAPNSEVIAPVSLL